MDDETKRLATEIGNESESDIFLYSGMINSNGWAKLIELFSEVRQNKPNVNLLLATYGGDINVAYRIARLFQKYSEKFSISIPWVCKSAGTLIVLGADEIIMSDFAEIGPLDVQLRRRTELWESRSGMEAKTAFEELRHETFAVYSYLVESIKEASQDQVSLDVAAKIASEITIGVMTPIYAQLDPDQIGYDLRNLHVATDYGQRLASYGGNVNENTISNLVEQYSSHRFIIDRQETETLFNKVEAPSEDMLQLWLCLNEIVSEPQWPEVIVKLNSEEEDAKREKRTKATRRNIQGNAPS